MTKQLLLTLALAASTYAAQAQISLTAAGTPSTIDFTGYGGLGFDPNPTAGQLSSNTWASSGMSDGTLFFGGSRTSADYTGQLTLPGVTASGFYSLDLSGNIVFWVQPTAADFSPGTLTLRVTNNTGAPMTSLDVAYDLLVFNDQARSNSFNFLYSTDTTQAGGGYVAVTSLDYTSTDVADATPVAIQTIPRSAQLTGLNIPDGGSIYLRWFSNDVGGTGSRDEFGLDNISVNIPTVSTPTISFNSASQTVVESVGAVTVDLNVVPATTCSVDVIVNASSTADASDYTTSFPATLNFVNGVSTLSVDITDDNLIEVSENLVLNITNATNGTAIGTSNTHTITITDNDLVAISGLVITEINYNDPAADSLEFVEVYNANTSNVNLTGVTFAAGITFTFPSNAIITAGERVVIAKYPAKMQAQLGYTTPYQFTGALLNTGELIQINDGLGNVVDSVRYGTTTPWANANGNGSTLTLCDVAGDNGIAAAWKASVVGTGFFLNGTEVKASPGQDDTTSCATIPVLSFDVANASVAENAGTYLANITLSNSYPFDVSVDVSASNGTADASDFTFSTSTVTFPANSTTIQTVSVVIIDDAIAENNEDFSLTLSNPVNATLGTATQVITITNDDILANPTLSFDQTAIGYDESAGTVSIPVSIIGANANATTVDVTLTLGTATSGTDYVFTAQTLTFPANSSASQNVSLSITDDAIFESSETLTLTLSNASNGATFVNDAVEVTILDDDPSGVNSLNHLASLSITPNPTQGDLNITLDNNVEASISVFDVTGQALINQYFNGTSSHLSLGHLAQGVYTIRLVELSTGETISKLVVVQ